MEQVRTKPLASTGVKKNKRSVELMCIIYSIKTVHDNGLTIIHALIGLKTDYYV